MVSRERLLKTFRACNALQRGHFELSSGLHSGHYFQCAQFLRYPKIAAKVCKELAARFVSKRPTAVIGPAIGGVLVAYEVARWLKNARALYAERIDAEMHLRRGFSVDRHDRVLVVEDVVTTGESARKVAELAEALGAKVVGIGAIVDRSGGRVKFPGRKYERLLGLDFEHFRPDDCPLCNERMPLTHPGRPKRAVL